MVDIPPYRGQGETSGPSGGDLLDTRLWTSTWPPIAGVIFSAPGDLLIYEDPDFAEFIASEVNLYGTELQDKAIANCLGRGMNEVADLTR